MNAPEQPLLIQQGLPSGCFYACPEANFASLEARIATAASDLALAQACGISKEGIAALGAHAGQLGATAQREIDRTTRAGETGPWRPNEDDAAAARISTREVRCCKFAGAVIFVKGKIDPVVVRRAEHQSGVS